MTNTAETYNGWTNRETWLVHLHLTNDESAYVSTVRTVRHAYETWKAPAMLTDYFDGDPEREHEARMYAVRDALENFAREWLEIEREALSRATEPGALFISDLVSTALARVDWDEIANGFEELTHE